MQLIISYDWAEGQWLAGQEGQQPTHLALRSIHVEVEKRKRSKRQRQSFFMKRYRTTFYILAALDFKSYFVLGGGQPFANAQCMSL